MAEAIHAPLDGSILEFGGVLAVGVVAVVACVFILLRLQWDVDTLKTDVKNASNKLDVVISDSHKRQLREAIELVMLRNEKAARLAAARRPQPQPLFAGWLKR